MNQNNFDFNILNMYPFVKTELPRTDPKFITQRKWEYNLMNKQRKAVSLCKNVAGIYTNDATKITDKEKENIEKCLRENFLKNDPNFFGKRDLIYLDLY